METKSINHTKGLLLVFLLSLVSWAATAQTIIARDQFEAAASTPNINFTLSGGANYTGNSAAGDRPASSPMFSEGARARGAQNTTCTMTSADVNTSGYSDIALTFRLAAFSINRTNNGMDNGDYVRVEISPDGGTNYYNTLEVKGNSNAYWAYSATGAASTAYDGNGTTVSFAPGGGGSRTTDGYSTVTVTNLPAVTNLRVRVSLVNNANRERWVVDDLRVSGTAFLPCAGTPVAGVAVATPNTITCSGTSVLTTTGFSTASGIAFQWEEFNGSSWVNVTGGSGATTATYTTATISAAKQYRVRVTCANSGISALSNEIIVSADAPVAGTATPAATSICTGTSTTITVSGHTSSGTTIQWESSTDNATWGNVSGGSGATTITYTTPNLAANIYYRAKITCTANGTTVNTTPQLITILASGGTSTVPVSDNFEANCTGWTFANGSNAWVINSGTNNGGTRSMYISRTPGGTPPPNTYNVSNTTVSHAYRDITFPNNSDCYDLKFDWKGQGESSYDYLQVFVVPTTTTPVSGTELATGQVGATRYNLSSAFASVTITLTGVAGTTQRVVFSWTNDSFGGTNSPAAAIDNFSVTSGAGVVPGAATALSPTGAYSSCMEPTLTWVAPASSGCNAATGYDVYFDEDGSGADPAILVSSNQTATSYSPTTPFLASNTYSWYVVPRNASGPAATPIASTFITSATAPTGSNSAPFTENFDGACASFTIVNGSQTNQWFRGPFVRNSGTTSMYVGTAIGNNNYNNASSSIVHFYRDVYFPEGSCYTLTFNYKGQGESIYDYLRVFLVPTSTTPVAGTSLTSGQLGANYYNLQAAYTGVTINIPNSNVGTTKRLVFSWRNDGSGGTNPAISVDDIVITASAPSAPSAAATAPSPSSGTTGLCAAPTLSWTAPTSTGCNDATGYDVYLNTSGTFVTPVSSNQAALNYSPGTLAAGTYYWKIVPRNSSGAYAIASCPTWIFNIGSGSVDNDLPCAATTLPLIVNLGGNNSCATGTSEAAAPAGWTGGTINSVWYRVTVPASGRLKIRTTLGTLTNTQIQLFTGTCSSLTSVAANDDAPACGSSYYYNSEISATGLTAGTTVFVRVDGANNLLGTFNIMAIDGNTSFPTSTGQACSASVPVCNSSMNIGDPGYQGIGFECDFSVAGCLLSGERGSVWYKIKTNATGALNFSIIPNDYDGVSGNETDYDFAIWKVAGTGAVNCASISPGSAASVEPLRCNYSFLGVTGLSPAGNTPAEYPGFDASYEPEITVATDDEYLLMISNFTNSTSGFTISFDDTAPIDYPTAGSVLSVTWTGSVDTDWFKPENWGGCTIPSALISANISPAAANQPVVTAKATCKDLNINLNSTLTLGLGGDIDIHGNYTNDGTLTALATTTVAFRGTAAQTLSGNLINESSFPNLAITKTAGSVLTNQDIEIQRNFTTSNVTSIFNGNSKMISVGGNFLNHTANTTFIPGAAGTLEFNGTTDQTYTNSNGTLELQNVIVNNTGGALVTVTLSNNLQLSTTGTLTFTAGILKTNANEIIVKNPSVAAVNAGSPSSYTWGYLRRFVNSTGSYNFPLGIAQNNLATVNFTGATTIHNLRGRFMPVSSFSSPSAGVIAEATGGGACNQPTYFNDGGKINTGAWEISAFNSGMTSIAGDGTYTITLSPAGFTNAGKYATIAKNGALAGTRVGCSDPTGGSVTVTRSGLTGFSEFDVVQAAEGILPVTLTSFNAAPLQKSIRLYWTTAQERNNNRFELLRSTHKGSDFEKIGEVRSAGNSNTRQDYQFEDNNVEANVVYYYVLRQVDNDGTPTYSKQVKASIGNTLANEGMVKIYPNPSRTNATIEVLVPESGSIEIRVTDMMGKVLSKTEKAVNAGLQSIELPTERIKTGAYRVTVIGENLHETLKFTKIE